MLDYVQAHWGLLALIPLGAAIVFAILKVAAIARLSDFLVLAPAVSVLAAVCLGRSTGDVGGMLLFPFEGFFTTAFRTDIFKLIFLVAVLFSFGRLGYRISNPDRRIFGSMFGMTAGAVTAMFYIALVDARHPAQQQVAYAPAVAVQPGAQPGLRPSPQSKIAQLPPAMREIAEKICHSEAPLPPALEAYCLAQ